MKNTVLTTFVFALAIAATQCVTQAQTNAAAPAGDGPRAGFDAVRAAENATGNRGSAQRGGGVRVGTLTADQIANLNSGITAAQADFTALQDKLDAAQKDAVDSALAKNDDATIQAKLEVVAKIQTDIAMLRFSKGVSAIAPSITEAPKTTISKYSPGMNGAIYKTFFSPEAVLVVPPGTSARDGGPGAGGGGPRGGRPVPAGSN